MLILIVDDSVITRSMLRRILQELGHQTLEATNGKEGLEMAQSCQPDLMFLDILMPEMKGPEVLQALNEKNINIPTIFMTADTQETTRAKCLELGAMEVFYKPPKMQTIKAILDKYLTADREVNAP